MCGIYLYIMAVIIMYRMLHMHIDVQVLEYILCAVMLMAISSIALVMFMLLPKERIMVVDR